MCDLHQSLLVQQVGVPESGPWRALILLAQITLLKGATADPALYDRIGGDLGRLGEVGCLACFRPDYFGAIVQAAIDDEPGGFKRLTDSWLADELARELGGGPC